MQTKTVRKLKQNNSGFSKRYPFLISEPFDMAFFIVVIVILAIGLIMLFSASYASSWYSEGDSFYYIRRQSFFAALGFVLMLGLSKLNYKYLRILAIPAYAASILLLLLVLIIGSGDGVEKRWIYIGFNFQPSEVAKLAVIIMLALYLSNNAKYLKKLGRGIIVPVMIIGAAAGLVLIEPHLSGAILILAVGVSMMIVAGCNFGWIGAMSAAAAVGLYFVATNIDYMKRRIDIWLNPGSDPLNDGYQILQSLYAIGSGGLAGQGIGQSRQKYLYVSKPQNDFIFSIVAEELGFIGCVIIIAIFAFLIYKGFVIAMRCPDRFGSLLVFGITVRLAVQVLLNLAVVTNSIPVTGISLPFFSSGGTALVMQMAEMGIVLSVSRQSRTMKV